MTRPSMDVFEKKRDAMRGWAHAPSTLSFVEWLDCEKDIIVSKLRDSKEVNEIFRLQGELVRIEKVIDLITVLKDVKPTGGK